VEKGHEVWMREVGEETGWEFTKLLRQIGKIFVTLKCFYSYKIGIL